MSSNRKSTRKNINGNAKAGISGVRYSRNSRRSSRLQNTKDYPKPSNPISKKPAVHSNQDNINEECTKNGGKNSLHGELQNLFDLSDDEEESFQSVLDDSLGTRDIHSSVSNKLSINDSQKDDTHNSSNTYIATGSSLQPEDVSKVLKMLSQPTSLNSLNSKPKSCLKTYSNPRKSALRNDIVESFGLPDTPIVPERPSVNNVLDTEILDASEITILDVKCIDGPWNITNTPESNYFSDLEEIRVKSDPQKHFKIRHPSGNLQDVENNDLVYTSTPRVETRSKSNISSTNDMSNNKKEKEVDIDSMKSNIRKLLSEKRPTNDIGFKPCRNLPKVVCNGNMSLTESEVEIFNTPSMSSRTNSATSVKTNRLSPTKACKNQNIHKTEKVVSKIRQNLRSSGKLQDKTPPHESSSKLIDYSLKSKYSSNKDESIDEEVLKILSKPKTRIPNSDEPIKFDDETLATPKRILRSKSSLDIPLKRKSATSPVKRIPYRNVKSSLGRRLRSLSQENVMEDDDSFEQNIIITRKIEVGRRKSKNSQAVAKNNQDPPKIISENSMKTAENVPQLKILLSPLKPSFVKAKVPLNSTRKSLRSYKELPGTSSPTEHDTTISKLVSTEDNSVSNNENLVLPQPSEKKLEAMENELKTDSTQLLDVEKTKKIRERVPQIFDDGSSSSESLDMDAKYGKTYPEPAPTIEPEEKVDEEEANQLELFISDFPSEICEELQENERDIQNNVDEVQLLCEDDRNSGETVSYQLTDELIGIKEINGDLKEKPVIPDSLLEKEESNILPVQDTAPFPSSKPPRIEDVEESEPLQISRQAKTIESTKLMKESNEAVEADECGNEEVTPTRIGEIIIDIPKDSGSSAADEESPTKDQTDSALIEGESKTSMNSVTEVTDTILEDSCKDAADKGLEEPLAEEEIASKVVENDTSIDFMSKIATEAEDIAGEIPQDQNNSTALQEEEVSFMKEVPPDSTENKTETPLPQEPVPQKVISEELTIEKPASEELIPEETNPEEKQASEMSGSGIDHVESVNETNKATNFVETTDTDGVSSNKDDSSQAEEEELVVVAIPTSSIPRRVRKNKGNSGKSGWLCRQTRQSRSQESGKLEPSRPKLNPLLASNSRKFALNGLSSVSHKKIFNDSEQSESTSLDDVALDQRIKRKRGRPKKVRELEKPSEDKISLPKPRLNGEILENELPEEKPKRKRGRPRKQAKTEKPAMSREVAKLLESDTAIVFNSSSFNNTTTQTSPTEAGREFSTTPFPRSSDEPNHSTSSHSQLFFEGVFDSQNTIADHVKKRPREMISYKISGINRLSVGSFKSKSFEAPSKQNTPFRSWKSLDFSESSMADTFTLVNSPNENCGVQNNSTVDEAVEMTGPSSPRNEENGDICTPVLEESKTNSSRSRKNSLVESRPKTEEKVEMTRSPGSRAEENKDINTPALKDTKTTSLDETQSINEDMVEMTEPPGPKAKENRDISTPVLEDTKTTSGRSRNNSLLKSRHKTEEMIEMTRHSGSRTEGNEDISTPVLEDLKTTSSRSRNNCLVESQLSELEDSSEVGEDTNGASNSDEFGLEKNSVVSNSGEHKDSRRSSLRKKLNENLSLEEPELSDISRQIVDVENKAESLSTPNKTVKHVPRSKTSLGERVKGSYIGEYPSVRGTPRRRSLDQDISSTGQAEEKTKLNEDPTIIPSLRISKQLRNAEPDNLRDIRGNLLKFKVGALAWARIGSFPYWPCLITKETNSELFVKNVLTKNATRTLYHVRFFGDKGRRAWISKHKMMVYASKDDLEKIYREMKVSMKVWPEVQFCNVKSTYLKKWSHAVSEAEEVKSKSLKEKLQFFEEASKPKTILKTEGNISTDANKGVPESPVKKRMKLPRPEKPAVDSNIKVDEVETVTKKKVKQSNPPSTVTADDVNKTAETVTKKKAKQSKPAEAALSSDETDQETKSPAKKPKRESEQEKAPKPEETDLEDNQTYSPRVQLTGQLDVKKSDDASEVGSKTSVDSLAIFSSHTLEAQKALFKRNNLFKGVSKEKVCQFCFKLGDVLKCKGGCNGVYHVQCAVKVLRERVPRGRTSKVPVKVEEVAAEEKNIKEESFEEGDKNGPVEKDKENDANLLVDDHVQIITVPSSVYNTPPRKTFPPDFVNLTLAEQIDYKMKEIMHKFESKTTYSESAIETRNANEASSPSLQPSPKTRQVIKSRSLFSPTAQRNCGVLDERLKILPQLLKSPNAFARCAPADPKEVIHVTADSTLEQTSGSSDVEEPLPKGPNTSEEGQRVAGHVTADSFEDDKEVKHVTADCESLDTSQSENSNSNSSQQSKQTDVSEVGEGSKYVNPKHFKCGFCTENVDPYCFVCHRSISKKGSNIRQKCSLYQCSRFYHPECLKLWPQTQWSLIQTTKHRYSQEEIDSFVCPQHVCHTCASDDPRAATSRCSGDKIVKCQRCPSTYHSTNLCVPAGSDILSTTQIVCPKHRGDKNKGYTINTTWCFLCSEGGNLICCETCPTSVHPECLPVNLTDDDKFICEDCESGRLPLYDEIVWVKLGKFRWWPGLVLFPNEIPPNVMNIKHSRGEFVVKFFGTYDHYWVNRGRSFLFQEGDAGDTAAVTVKKKVEEAFNRAVEEAVIVHKLKKEFKLSLDVESLNSQKPPPYIKIKVNKPVGNVRQMELDLSNTTACECDPSQPHPCGPDTDCLNRLLMTECNPEVCPAGKRCNNQSFEKREYPPMIPYKTQSRGWGLKSLAPIKKGQFVVEYVGEIIDDEEYQRRIQKMHEQKEENYYFLTIDKDRMIDAGPKGNVARFMNHCCQPNCETQKWTVNGDTRVGLFATVDIPAETELTFNYNLECIGKEKKICRCGAPNCSGFIGVKAKQETESKRPKKTYKKKEPVKPLALPPCFICGRKGNVGPCNNKICNKAYHLKCLKMTEWPEGNKFVCPWHNCKICSKRTIRCCVKCINSYCPSHSEGNVRYDNLLGFVCTNHDPTKSQNEQVPLRKKRSSAPTEETAVTSTTSDDFEDTEDEVPLSDRTSRRKKTTKKAAPDLEESHLSPNRSQDETVSSATASDLEEAVILKRKRRRRRSGKIGYIRKKARLSLVQKQSNTATDTDVSSKVARLEVDDT
nr:uncharacterized protein LOC111517303 [Leptinotarsa decemlineata]XP_023029171.1 uncharacterized protein LOC111517303 [Leptinotarsa decemlineata]XP_023029172.1 uncharacterized protein LOC111517303 [Leptinotarsa decemlineata]